MSYQTRFRLARLDLGSSFYEHGAKIVQFRSQFSMRPCKARRASMIIRADSEYSIRSFKKHGFLIGWMMTTDRLFRCGRDEVRLSPQVISDNRQGVLLGNYDAALTSLNNLITIAPNQEVADEAHYQKAGCIWKWVCGGVLAIIPGAGHLYCGRKRDALLVAAS